ncbi:MAG: exo-alpha-sialidase [Clostridia bacterium]|nr:exo-alpha-sialidase [Clostridia bacterium]
MNGFINYEITPREVPCNGIMFVDHQKAGRSGHLSHALVEYKKGCVMAFYSNCSPTRNKWAPGHNGFGWLEYKRSTDGGKTWDSPRVFPYSWDSFINQPFTVSCEKAVSTKENEIIALCIRNENPNGWEPYLEPVVVISEDGGESWSEAALLCDKKGRVYDAIVHDGSIYVLMLANDDWLAKRPDDRYYIYRSDDSGKSFYLWSELPGDTNGHAYGNMAMRDDGAIICYEYDANDEFNMVYHISFDMGKTWVENGKSYCAKRIRNPQVASVKGGFILHGRSGCDDKTLPMNFVLYTSKDGINWDDGTFICVPENGMTAFYSNNLVLNLPDGGQRVLIQSSVPYSKGCVNIAHWFLDIK